MAERQIISHRFLKNSRVEIKLSKNQIKGIANFKKIVKDSNYFSKKTRNCTICKKNNFILISEKDRFGFFYPTRICKNCGLIQANPYYNEEVLLSLYENYYRQIYSMGNIGYKMFFQGESEKGRRIFKFIEEKLKIKIKNKKILEVGCGAGGILKHFKEKENNVKGLDMGGEHFTKETTKHLNLEKNTLKNFINNNKSFKPDIIIYSHVIEHLLNPLEELKLVNKISHKDTIIYIEVPSIYRIKKSYQSDILSYFNNAHAFSFTLTSLTNLFKLAGFKRIFGNEETKAIFKISESPQKITKENPQEIIKYLKNLEIKYSKIPFKKQRKAIRKIHSKLNGYRPYNIIIYTILKNIRKTKSLFLQLL
jgi:2-polyprenyl-3-methyl-5-hydroxy-6-metoxy-1,4-benzoquinol methylase